MHTLNRKQPENILYWSWFLSDACMHTMIEYIDCVSLSTATPLNYTAYSTLHAFPTQFRKMKMNRNKTKFCMFVLCHHVRQERNGERAKYIHTILLQY